MKKKKKKKKIERSEKVVWTKKKLKDNEQYE